MKERIEELLQLVRPRLALHGGNVSFVDYTEETGLVRLKMEGACQGCPLSQLTLKVGIEALLKGEIPEIQEVQAVEV
jgi:Fe-S cluster biogenesis protein NfuA